jgi:hypothetical protein
MFLAKEAICLLQRHLKIIPYCQISSTLLYFQNLI